MSTVAQLKALATTYVPVFGVAFYFQSAVGSPTLLLSTHPFNGTGGPTFPGIGVLPAGSYEGRIKQEEIDAFQLRSKQGVDRPASISFKLSDPDRFIWLNYCFGAGKYGFRGATVKVALFMWQPGTSNFSSDAPLMFIGTCDEEVPVAGGTILSVSANNSHNMATVMLPMFPIQPRCPLHFPANATERAMAADQASGMCMYCPTQTPGQPGKINPVGNTTLPNQKDNTGRVVADSNGIYITCDYIRSNGSDTHSGCMARLGNRFGTNVAPDGDLMHDESHRPTGGFAGVEWSPGTYYSIVKNFTNNTKFAAFSFFNASVIGQYHNMVYGAQWVTPKIANVVESGNDTKAELMLCTGDIGSFGVTKVLMNGVLLSKAPSGDKNLWYDFNNTGSRFGSANPDTNYSNPGHSALGDPYGSIACLRSTFFKDVFTGTGIPSPQVQMTGPKIWAFSDQTTKAQVSAPFGEGASGVSYNNNPAWVVLDLLNKANWQYSEMDMSTFISTAAVCSTFINYTNQFGQVLQHARFKCQFSLEQRKSAGDVIAAVLRGFGGYLVYGDNGLLQLYINQTLADSQPAPITGSNYNTAITSVTATGGTASGYVAYAFNETNISRVKQGDNEVPDIQGDPSATVQSPNQVSIQFQDEYNDYQVDSLTQVDAGAIATAAGALQPGGSLVNETMNVLGPPNFDQSIRIANVYLAERNRGNERGDASGTRIINIGSSVNCEHLRVGHLVYFKYPDMFQSYALFRVLSKQCDTDGVNWRIKLQMHQDIWYTDAYGQYPQDFYSDINLNRPRRAPHPWQPFAEQPVVPLANVYPQLTTTEWGFQVGELDDVAADGTPFIQIQVSGRIPVSQIQASTQPPAVPVQASTTSTGGTIPGGLTLLIHICGLDSGGDYTAHSHKITAQIPSGTNTNTVTISGLGWPTGIGGWDLFAGPDHYSITHQLASTTAGIGNTPSSITLTSLPNVLAYAAPDLTADSIVLQAKAVAHGGIIGEVVVAVDATSVTIGGAGATFTNNLVGYFIMLAGRQSLDGDPLPIVHLKISAQVVNLDTSIKFTVDRNPTTGPGGGYIQVADVVIISAQANIASSTTIGDANFVSAYAPTGVIAEDVGNMVRIMWGTGRGQVRTITAVASGTTYTIDTPWDTTPDATSMFIVEAPEWSFLSNSTSIRAYQYLLQTLSNIPIANYRQQAILIQALIQDPNGKQSNQYRSPLRMMWLTGAQGTRVVTTNTTQRITDGLVLFDTTAGNITYTCLPFVQVPNQLIIWQKTSADANTVTIQATGTDAFDELGNQQIVLTDNGENGKSVFKVFG